MDPRLLSAGLAAASAAALAANLFSASFLPLILGIVLALSAAGVSFRATKGRPGAERALPALGILAGLAAFSMYRVAMKAFAGDAFNVDLILNAVRVLGYVPAVAILAGALATVRFADVAARAGLLLALGLAVASGVAASLGVADVDVPAALRPGGVDALALAAFLAAAGAAAWTAWRHRAPQAAPHTA